MVTDLNFISKAPRIFLVLGVISIAAALIWTITGQVWVRLNGWVYRAKEPKWFWWEVALYYLVGICFIGYFFVVMFRVLN